jgi:hypothetical protein
MTRWGRLPPAVFREQLLAGKNSTSELSTCGEAYERSFGRSARFRGCSDVNAFSVIYIVQIGDEKNNAIAL